jgi:hypothetical protein
MLAATTIFWLGMLFGMALIFAVIYLADKWDI